VKLEIALCLPQDASTVGMVRDVAVGALGQLGLTAACVEDIRLALSEACTNVIEHSGAEDEFEVRLEVSGDVCEIRVIDSGRGLDFEALEAPMPPPTAPRGRGLAIIRAVVDAVDFESEPEAGTMVHLVKRLEIEPGGPLHRLLSDR
jgi:serine/threonine-protein kinase RsbW